MSDKSSSRRSTSSSSFIDEENVYDVIQLDQPWVLEPRVVRRRERNNDDQTQQDSGDDERVVVPQDMNPDWCQCGGVCVVWPQQDMNHCCRDNPVWDTKSEDEMEIQCITESTNIKDLLRAAPLRVAYTNFCTQHPQRQPDATTLVPNNIWSQDAINRLHRRQQRLSGYRQIIFFTYPYIGKGQRRPLPSCIYMMIWATYPDTDNDEEFANADFSVYVPELN